MKGPFEYERVFDSLKKKLATVESAKGDAPVKHYRCAACGEDFNEPLRSHTRAVMGKDGNPEPMECGPIFEYAFEYAPVTRVTMEEVGILVDAIWTLCYDDGQDESARSYMADFLREKGFKVVEDKEPR